MIAAMPAASPGSLPRSPATLNVTGIMGAFFPRRPIRPIGVSAAKCPSAWVAVPILNDVRTDGTIVWTLPPVMVKSTLPAFRTPCPKASSLSSKRAVRVPMAVTSTAPSARRSPTTPPGGGMSGAAVSPSAVAPPAPPEASGVIWKGANVSRSMESASPDTPRTHTGVVIGCMGSAAARRRARGLRVYHGNGPLVPVRS